MLEALNSIDIVDKLDTKINDAIENIISTKADYNYTLADLDKKINDEETLREYIADSEETFYLPKVSVDDLTNEELNNYVKQLDKRWCSKW